MLQLLEAGKGNIEKEFCFVRDIPQDENGFINDWHGLSRPEYEGRALPEMMAWSRGEQLPEGFVPETFLFLWLDDEIIGQFRIRHHLCESLASGAGHIGYFIDGRYRGLGYGSKGLQMALEAARNIIPEDEFYLRVNRDNAASLRVMMKNGGYIHHSDDQKYYVRIPK